MTPNQKTGDRKCWHVRNRETNELLVRGPLAKDAAYRMASRHMNANPRVIAALCLDGYHFEPCPGQAHDPNNGGGYIDNCMTCAPRWGVVMVEDE